MANVEIIIRIPESEYKHIRNFLSDSWVKDKGLPTIAKAFLDGIVLDKDHGRIIDINKMEYLKAIHDAKYGEISWSEAIKQIKNSAPTILAAR